MRRWIALICATLAVSAALFAAAYWAGHATTLLRLEERGEAVRAQVSDRLLGQIDRYRYLPAVLADHPGVIAAAAAGSVPTLSAVNSLLERVADTSGALDIYLMRPDGLTIASSNWQLDRSFMGRNFAYRPYFQRAIRGGLGFYHAVGTTSGQRGFYFAHPVRGADHGILGALAVKLDLEDLESAWRADVQVVFFSDARGVIFLANRDALVLRALSPEGALPPASEADERQYADQRIAPLAADPRSIVGGKPAWTLSGISGVPDQALWLTNPLETVGLTAHVLVDTREARAQGLLWGALAAATGGLLALGTLLTIERRRTLSRQLAAEARANAALETQVANRTEELRATNAALRAEVDQHIATETRLREVQDQLVQSAKLTALGEMSAGISHELNQPLTAIQTLADNAEVLMTRQRYPDAAEAMTRIGALAGRAGRIIRNLRRFARNEALTVEDVDLTAIIADALDISAARLRAAGVEVDWTPPPHPVLVRGGRVRLQQVIVNLISNAADAMEGQGAPARIILTLVQAPGDVVLSVRDTGPGLASDTRVFDPFYTTKEVGEGLGLGLSISYGIVKSFGGDITGRTDPQGGAIFTLRLPRAQQAAA